ncbi:hypothetical protein L2E82_24456 [Cichorium intybus]|uniref:Uncharacterized protein n=1 Tax=Cichorium intybus TaxID=13427 RepID=A0ACB9E091_CICIN|nr:hypothetical protein L2E82_24456 [Cichorium intybus]
MEVAGKKGEAEEKQGEGCLGGIPIQPGAFFPCDFMHSYTMQNPPSSCPVEPISLPLPFEPMKKQERRRECGREEKEDESLEFI